MTTIIKNGYLHTCEDGDIKNGYICFADGKITGVGAMEQFDASCYPGAEVIDAGGRTHCARFY